MFFYLLFYSYSAVVRPVKFGNFFFRKTGLNLTCCMFVLENCFVFIEFLSDDINFLILLEIKHVFLVLSFHQFLKKELFLFDFFIFFIRVYLFFKIEFSYCLTIKFCLIYISISEELTEISTLNSSLKSGFFIQ